MLKDQQVAKAEGSSVLQVHGRLQALHLTVLFNHTLSGRATGNMRDNKVR